MGTPSSSGYYVSRAVALLLAGLVAALLLALVILAAFYGHCARVPPSALPGLWDSEAECSPPRRQKSTPTPTPGSAGELAVTTTPRHERPSGPWDHLRLPPWLLPLHYDLELWPLLTPDKLPARSLLFYGRVNITVRCTVATVRLLLHSLFQDCEGAEVRGPLSPGTGNTTVGRVPVDKVWFAVDTEYMVLELGEPLQPGSSYELQLSFSGVVFEDLREGLFFSVYTDQGERR
ncbi:hypothetical protein P7K49_005091 [Saguinus oedipus]|uniref:Aminopeptidase N-like N-terminal domain-containing protein n=1 Tax=Saguinus oedipus TaxID=9490 RepID=A0ABQ9W999_SAGOE|nr:hypothetical protein P7K49_005091 [Saguinus oedipus]